MKKILIVSTLSRHFYLFEKANIRALKSLGYEIHGASNRDVEDERLKDIDIKLHYFDIKRSPFSFSNVRAYKQLKEIVEREKIDIIHCHNPMGGVLGRLVAKKLKISTVIYTAHGFHFFKGGPFLSWLLYYPVEKYLSKYTDILITINNEDYNLAKNKFFAKKVEKVPGVGIDFNYLKNIDLDRYEKRKEICIPKDCFLIFSVGELSKRKNHEVIIKAISEINNHNIHYAICGKGVLKDYLINLSRKLGVEDRIHFLGYRKDVGEVCKCSDLFAFPSKREGLGLAALEAMACGLPIITSNINGINDYSVDGKTGYTCSPNDVSSFKKNILKFFENRELYFKFSEKNIEIAQKYSIEESFKKVESIYKEI